MNKNGETIDLSSVKKVKFSMIVWFSVIFTLSITVISALIIRQTNKVLKNKVSDLGYELNSQTCANLNSYIAQVEGAAEYLKEATKNLDIEIQAKGYSNVEREGEIKELTDFFANFSIIKKYSDLAVIFENGYYAGILKPRTSQVIDTKKLYDNVEKQLQETRNGKLWITGHLQDYSRIIFAKRISSDAIFVCSLDTAKFNDYISRKTSKNLVTYIVDKNNTIIYSTDSLKIGTKVPLPTSLSSVNFDRDNMYTVNTCSNGWYLITSSNLHELLKERKNLITFVIVLACLATGFIIIFSIVFSLRLTQPIERLVASLHNQATKDRITKLLNAETFEKEADTYISESGYENMAVFYMDIDRFGSLVDILGHTECDNIIFEVADSLRRTFPKHAVIGRLGHDRFAVCTPISQNPDEKDSVLSFSEKLQQELFTKFQSEIDITMSIGVSLYPAHGKNFNLLFDMSERAMNTVKKTTRNDWHIFDPSKDINSWS